MVIWLIGLSGAGKTTIGKPLYAMLKAANPNTVLLDGDEMRKVFGANRGPEDYTVDARRRNAERVVGICQWLDSQDIHVVCCFLSAFQEHRDRCRKTLGDYLEVFVDVPLPKLIERDDKGLYGGDTENVVGLDIPFEVPARADLVIDNAAYSRPPSEIANEIATATRLL